MSIWIAMIIATPGATLVCELGTPPPSVAPESLKEAIDTYTESSEQLSSRIIIVRSRPSPGCAVLQAMARAAAAEVVAWYEWGDVNGGVSVALRAVGARESCDATLGSSLSVPQVIDAGFYRSLALRLGSLAQIVRLRSGAVNDSEAQAAGTAPPRPQAPGRDLSSSLLLAVDGGVDTEALDRWFPAAGVRLSYRGDHVGGGLTLVGAWPYRQPTRLGPGRVDRYRAAAELELSIATLGSLMTSTSAGAGALILRGRAGDRSRWSWIAMLAVGLRLRWLFRTGFALVVSPELEMRLKQVAYVVTGEPLFTTSQLAGRARVGLEVAF